MLLPALIAFAGFINFFRFAPVQTKPAPETSPAEIDDLVVQTAGDDRNPPESVISPPTDPTAVLADDLSESGETGTLTPRSHAVGEDLLHEGGTTGYEDSGADEADLNASRRKSEKKAAAKKRTELEKRIKRAKKYGDNGTDVPKLEELAYPKSAKDFQRHFQRLLPFIWPEDRKLQFSITLCVGIMLLGRYVTWLVPRQYKEVINALGLNFSGSDVIGMLSFGTDWHLFASSVIRWVDGGQWKLLPWREILTFVFLSFLQGGVGLLDTVQNFLWIPVGQFTTRAISLKMFAHLHNLSLRFHINRKTGEILRVQDRGVASIVSILSSILFNIVPTLVDIVIAVVWFTVEFDLNFGYIVFCTMLLYLYFTIALTEWRTKHRRYANQLDNVVEAKAVDSLLNFETVKYYNAERFELDQYTTALSNYQKADFVSSVAVTLLNNVQNLIIQLGLLVGCILCAKRIVIEKTMSLGDFVLYIAYINQLYRPLNWFGSYYRVIQKNFVDMEKMLDLLKEPVEVKDAPNAPNLVVTRGEVVFENVSFSYDPRVKTLEDITFRVPQGSTVALVGPSGSGKSTVLRLLFRFYDTETGRILIDGQDIRHVTQESLREHIGVVPQDTVLFNDTIRYNILYGRPKADGAEIVAAAKAAQIHNRIKRFPDGYNTRVGERGLRLSGGEKQRVAIARTLLKNPAIVLLDEATSALDTQTERQIQHQLTKMTEGRTTLVIAHRLSTIVNAQLILVLANGKIIERGKHSELMTAGGVYFDMWMKQLRDHDGISEAGSR
ncbi:P-loop containing nucleoside triphosphate hydrolase protein [Cladochytrium replicatum]|nr:P-loop containing nucleoside triphosphate hydrolase protein [Cladochytrium replicatum]